MTQSGEGKSMKYEQKPIIQPPYYAVIFTSFRVPDEDQLEGYDSIGEQLEAAAKNQKGYLGMDSVRDGLGITVSYWETLEDIKNWKQDSLHKIAQRSGRSDWYQSFTTRICKVEKQYSFERM